jgi:hypothetical protein
MEVVVVDPLRTPVGSGGGGFFGGGGGGGAVAEEEIVEEKPKSKLFLWLLLGAAVYGGVKLLKK